MGRGWAGPKVLGPKPTVGWARARGFGPLVGFEDVDLRLREDSRSVIFEAILFDLFKVVLR